MNIVKLIIPKSKKFLKYALDEKGKKYFKKGDGLPNGILNKKYTGIGATTLEILADRPSIIVSPTRALAKSKYLKTIDENKSINCLCVAGDLEIRNEDIKAFDLVDNTKKKIFVVADSLPRLIKNLGDDVYDSYFLLIDEIDTFQVDTSFRSALEYAVDYFHEFKNAVAISATLISFSDERFSQDKIQYYDVEVEDFKKSELNLISSERPNESLLKLLIPLLDSDEKILLAVNSMGLINKYIKNLLKTSKIKPEDIAVLCGDSSANKIYTGVKRDQLSRDCKLPKKLNFMTSAYFAGIDIKEPYHSITLNSEYKEHTIMTFENIHQIIGRGRDGLLSNLLISFRRLKKSYDVLQEEDILARTKLFEEMSKSVELIYKDKYEDDKESVFENIANTRIKGRKGFLRIDVNNKILPSYFTIDYNVLRSKNLLALTVDLSSMIDDLEDYYIINITHDMPSEIEEMEELKGKDYIEAFIDKYDEYRLSFIKKANKLHKLTGDDLIMMGYADELIANLYNKRNLHALILMMLLEELHGLEDAKIQFQALNTNSIQKNKIKRIIKLYQFFKSASFSKFIEYFKLNDKYSINELRELITKAHGELNLGNFIDKHEIKNDATLTELIRTLFSTKTRTPEIDGKRVKKHEILSFNSNLFSRDFKHKPSYELQRQFGADLETYLLNFNTKILEK